MEEDIDWPHQNDKNVVPAIEGILRERFGLRPLRDEPIDIEKSDCAMFKQCAASGGEAAATCALTMPQKVIKAIVRPDTGYNLMLRHDVGTGKTCAALEAAYNYAADGRYVWWVTRYNLISSVKKALYDEPSCCFGSGGAAGGAGEAAGGAADARENVFFYSYKRFVNYIWPPEKLRNYLNSHSEAKNNPIRERPGYPTRDAVDERRRLGGDKWEMDDVLSGQLLIIDEPQLLWEVKSGEGDPDMFNVVRALIEYSYNMAAKRKDHEPVTVLLLTATPGGSQNEEESDATDQIARAAMLVNLLIRNEKERFKPIEAVRQNLGSKKGQAQILNVMRGYISYFDGSNNITRFAEVEAEKQIVMGEWGAGEDEDVFSQDEAADEEEEEEYEKYNELDLGETDDEPEGGGAGGISKREQVMEDAEYDGALQLVCARQRLEIPANDDERKKIAQCYLNNSVLPVTGRRYLPQVYRDFNLVDADKKDMYLETLNLKGPKLRALYDNVMAEPGGKHFIISNANTNTAVGATASLFGAHQHPKVILDVDASGNNVVFKEMLSDGTVRPIVGPVEEGAKGRYIVLTRSAVLFKGGQEERDILKRFRNQVFDFINRRPDNVHGRMVQYIIADKSYREGVSFFDILHAHLLEPMPSTDETQAIGRVRRMCGQCALPYVDGWKLKVTVYDVRADRLPWFAVKKSSDFPIVPSKDNKEYKPSNVDFIESFRVGCERNNCGEYGFRIVQILENRSLQKFMDLFREAAIDRGFYDIKPVQELRAEVESKRQLKRAKESIVNEIKSRIRSEKVQKTRALTKKRKEATQSVFVNSAPRIQIADLIADFKGWGVADYTEPKIKMLAQSREYLLGYTFHLLEGSGGDETYTLDVLNGTPFLSFAILDEQFQVKSLSREVYTNYIGLEFDGGSGAVAGAARAMITDLVEFEAFRATVDRDGKIDPDEGVDDEEDDMMGESEKVFEALSEGVEALDKLVAGKRITMVSATRPVRIGSGGDAQVAILNVRYVFKYGKLPPKTTPLGTFLHATIHEGDDVKREFSFFALVKFETGAPVAMSNFFWLDGMAADVTVSDLFPCIDCGGDSVAFTYAAHEARDIYVQKIDVADIDTLLKPIDRSEKEIYFTTWK